MSMGERLREARNKIGYSQEEVARRIDLDRTTIGKYENDACVPSSTTLARLVEIYCYYVEKTAITFEYEVPAVEEFQQRMVHVMEKYPYLVAKVDDQIVGYAYAGTFNVRAAYDWCVETSIYVDHTLRKCGVGKRLYQALEIALKAQNITNLNACISSPIQNDEYLDTNSIDYHHHLGYQMVGEFHQCGYKFKRWYNMVWMEKFIGEHHENQLPMIQFNEIKDQVNLNEVD